MHLDNVRRCVIALALLGCRESRDRRGVDSSAAPSPAAAPVVAAPRWHVVSWEPYAGVDPADLGVGVAYLTHAEDKGAPTGTDTLLLRSSPNDTSSAIGAMLFTVGTNGVTQYSIAALDSLRPNLVEHGYEESGVPFDSVDASGRWVRGILGFAPDSAARVGWIDTGRRGVGLIRWAQQLADRPIYFPRPEAAAFFAAPDSTTRVATPRGGDDGYAIHPIDARGPWLRVKVVTPSDNCAESDSVPHRTRTVWIRYLDDRGRPNVWYYARGC
jgi:hypothetical protein